MRVFKPTAILLAIASNAAAQDLPPDLLLLAHIKAHMREELSRVTNYTCLETTTRFRAEHGSKLQPLDTVRLEIVYANGHEWYGSPGDKNLNENNPVAFIGSGMIGTGSFGIILSNLFLSDGATFAYRGQESLDGKPAVRYDFSLPRLLGGVKVSLVTGFGKVGEKGSFWADPQSLDLIRLQSQADEIPPYLALDEMTSIMNYARTRIGESNALLPQEGDLYMLTPPTHENYNHLEYTHCRAFSAQSTIHFDSEPQAAAQPLPASAPQISVVPPFLPVTIQLVTPIGDHDSVGTLIEAKVAGNVVRKGKIVIPDRALVQGRIRRLEQYNEGADFIVGLEFTEVDVNGESLRFYADLLKMDRRPGIRPTLHNPTIVWSHSRYETRTITLPELPGVASFFVTGNTFTIPAGFQMTWRTRGLIH